MWTCPHCGQTQDQALELCERCARPRPGTEGGPITHRMAFELFRGGPFDSWPALFRTAADFATRIGPDRLVNISHSESDGRAVVTVWYWEPEPPVRPR